MTRAAVVRRARMGGACSVKKKETKWSWSGPPGEHSPYPVDPVPYPGPDLLYCFLDLMVSHKILRNLLNLGHQAVTTNVEDFADQLDHCYEEGFSLNEFVRIPGVRTTTELQDWGHPQPYQAILSKPCKISGPPTEEKWCLTIEKRILSTKTLAFDETDEDNDLIRTITTYAKEGARLVCTETIGYVQSESTNTQYGVIGVELFFNVPKHENPTIYTYHAVKVKARYVIVPDATQTVQQIVCDADFHGQIKLFLDEGWKLVDICTDSTAMAEAFKMRAASKTIDTIFIFEKEEAKLTDLTPQYEAVIIEYKHSVKSTLEGENPRKDWRPVIAGMGVAGWELACIIQTPALVQNSFTTYSMKLLMIFQRKLIPSFEKLRRLKSSNSIRNDEDTFYGAGSYSAGMGGLTRKLSQGSYYHHTLKRYVYGEENMANGDIPTATKIDSPPPYWEAVRFQEVPIT